MVYNWLNIARNLLFAPQCRLCLGPGDEQLDLCGNCHLELPWAAPACIRCASPLPEAANVEICARCQLNSPPLDRCEALFSYQAPVDGWIQQLKFHEDLGAAQLLGKLLASRISPLQKDFQVLPIPLHKKRLRERGYNQALEISRPLLGHGFKLLTEQVRREKITAAQSGLNRKARTKNLRGAFSVPGMMKNKNILIIDDVMTTGATLNELAIQLHRAGAGSVHAWVVARTTARH